MKLFKPIRPDWKWVVVALFIVMQVWLIFIKKHDALDIDTWPNTQPTPAVAGPYDVGQTFVAERDGIARIDVMVGTYGRTNTKNIIFELSEVVGEKEKLFVLNRTVTFSPAGLMNNLFNPIRFAPVEGSRGKRYLFTLRSPESTPEDSICLWMNTLDIYRWGHLFYNNAPAKGDLVFRVYSRRTVGSELGRIVRNYPGIFGSKTFLIIVVIAFEIAQVLMLIYLLNLFFGRPAEKGRLEGGGEPGGTEQAGGPARTDRLSEAKGTEGPKNTPKGD